MDLVLIPFHPPLSHLDQLLVVVESLAPVAGGDMDVFLLSSNRASIPRSSSSMRARASSRYFSCDRCVCSSCEP